MTLLARVGFAALVLGSAVVGYPAPPPPPDAKPSLELSITPMMALAPVDEVRITARVEPHPRNRGIRIALENERYFRASFIQLDGDESAKTHTVRFNRVPGGQQTVVSVDVFNNDGKVWAHVQKLVTYVDARDAGELPADGSRLEVRGSGVRGESVPRGVHAEPGRCTGDPLRAWLLPGGSDRAGSGARPGQAWGSRGHGDRPASGTAGADHVALHREGSSLRRESRTGEPVVGAFE